MQQLDELRAFIANPRTRIEELEDLLRNAEEQLRVYEQAGVGTLIVSPVAATFEERREQLRRVAELA